MKSQLTKTNYSIFFLVSVFTLLIFIIDILTPIGINLAALYLIPILLTIQISGQRITSLICSTTLLLTFIAFFLSPEGGAIERAIINRLLIVLGIGITWYIVLKNKQKEKIMIQQSVELLKKESRFKLATDAANVGVWSLDIPTQELEWSTLHKKMWGYEAHRTKFSNEDWQNIILEEDKELVLNKLETARINHTSYEIEYRIKKPNDTVIYWMKSTGMYYYNKAGEAVTLTGITINITDSKETVEEIKKARELFELTLHNVPSAVYHFNNKGEILYLNQLGALQMGYDSIEEVLQEKDVYQFRKKIDERFDILNEYGQPLGADESCSSITLKTAKPAEVIIQFIDKKLGSSFWLLTKSVPKLNAKGELTNVFTACTDITQQKESELIIEKMASHFKLATDSANVGVWSLNVPTQELEWSDFHKKMWGYDAHRNDLTYEDWHKIILEEDKTLAFQRVEEARVNNTKYEVEYRIKRPNDSSIRWMRSFGQYYYNELGEAQTLTGISIDITKQKATEEKIKQSEDQFRTFADSIQNLAWIADGNGWIYWYNQRWYDYTGTTLEEMEGWGWQKVHHPEHSERVVALLKEAWKKDEAWELTFPLRGQDGEYRWFLTRAYPVKDATGTIERWIGTNTDITEQKNFTEELEKKVTERTEELAIRGKQLEEINQALDLNNVALENANEELKSFSYIASHDLQEPLRMIKLFSNRIIDTEQFSDKTQNYFNFIIGASERMGNLIVSLIDYSRIDNTELNFVYCDLNTIVEETKIDLQLRIAEKKAVITYENLPSVYGQHIQLLQLFTNLIGNSIKYCKPDIIPHIKITSERILGKAINHPSADNQLEYSIIKIADNGIGFEEEFATKIFEAFQRLHARNEFTGTGIGLSIVKKIVANHKGFILAEGKPNIGSTFTIYLPIN